MSTEIRITHVKPPIPRRDWDWCAFFDGEEEAGPYGWGATQFEAVLDLLSETSIDKREHAEAIVAWLCKHQQAEKS
jgi:hypothetical protein